MDKFDLIILSAISDSCRVSLSSIGKKIKRSPQFVKYRIEQLKKQTIKQISFITDFYKEGFFEVTALIKFPIIDPLTEKMFIDYLFKRKETYKLASINGEYSIICSFIIKDASEVNQIKEELLEIAEFEVVFFRNYKTEIFSQNYLSEHRSEKKILLKETITREEPTTVMNKILSELQTNPFASNLEISNKISETYEKVSYAVDKKYVLGNNLLLADSIVKKAFVFMKVSDINRLKNYSQVQKNVVEVNYITGSYDVMVIIESLDELKYTIKQTLFELKEIIQEFTVFESNNFYKYGWYK